MLRIFIVRTRAVFLGILSISYAYLNTLHRKYKRGTGIRHIVAGRVETTSGDSHKNDGFE